MIFILSILACLRFFTENPFSIYWDNIIPVLMFLCDFSKASTKGEYLFQFKGGKGRYPWVVTLSVFDSGSATIYCSGSGARYMTYFANLIVPEKDEDHQ